MFNAFSRYVKFPFELVAIKIVKYDECLRDMRHGIFGEVTQTIRTNRDFTPPCNSPAFIRNFAFNQRYRFFSGAFLLREENHCHAIGAFRGDVKTEPGGTP